MRNCKNIEKNSECSSPFFFFAENVCRMGSVKKGISSVCAYWLCFLFFRIFDNIVLSKIKDM
jgi:hypothetical protein